MQFIFRWRLAKSMSSGFCLSEWRVSQYHLCFLPSPPMISSPSNTNLSVSSSVLCCSMWVLIFVSSSPLLTSTHIDLHSRSLFHRTHSFYSVLASPHNPTCRYSILCLLRHLRVLLSPTDRISWPGGDESNCRELRGMGSFLAVGDSWRCNTLVHTQTLHSNGMSQPTCQIVMD